MSIWKYSHALPDLAHVTAATRMTLGEGATPLIRSRQIGPASGLENLYFKIESINPTGSYKDRFAAAAVSDMIARGSRMCLATSSGNTGSALAAYCAAAKIDCSIAIVDGAPLGKVRQMQAYGARLYSVRQFGCNSDVSMAVMDVLQQKASNEDASLQISAFKYSPVGMSGVQTLAYEMADQLPDRLDHVFCQAGGGGLTLAVARGFAHLQAAGSHAVHPAIHCVQPEGNDTIATPLRQGKDQAQSIECTSSISGLQVANVIDGDEVIAACRRSGGNGHLVTDEEVFALQARLAREEGVFCEPAGAVSLAGVLEAHQAGEIDADAYVVCLITGSGFKDESSLKQMTATADMPLLESAQQVGAFLDESR